MADPAERPFLNASLQITHGSLSVMHFTTDTKVVMITQNVPGVSVNLHLSPEEASGLVRALAQVGIR